MQQPILLKDGQGNVVGRQITVLIYNDGKMQVHGPSDRDLLIHCLQKAIEAVRAAPPIDTNFGGVNIFPANTRIKHG